ncbi:hypothetical protein QUF74_06360 [Candidatus Halobeggiatoa sp. HSG11]|nr:hypothetical protein [Candidatus Halobeggiatoa sp. HSG11]
MSYSQFSLPAIVKIFKLKTVEKIALFGDITPLFCSTYLKETLDYNVPR